MGFDLFDNLLNTLHNASYKWFVSGAQPASEPPMRAMLNRVRRLMCYAAQDKQQGYAFTYICIKDLLLVLICALLCVCRDREKKKEIFTMRYIAPHNDHMCGYIFLGFGIFFYLCCCTHTHTPHMRSGKIDIFMKKVFVP